VGSTIRIDEFSHECFTENPNWNWQPLCSVKKPFGVCINRNVMGPAGPMVCGMYDTVSGSLQILVLP
jgi:hypothetical protein